MRKGVVVVAVLALSAAARVSGAPPISGTFLVSNDASESPDFVDLGAAFDFLEANLLNGPIVFEISEGVGPYTSTASYTLEPVNGASASNRITIRPQAGERPVIDGAATVDPFLSGNATIQFLDTAFVTLEGLEITGGVDAGVMIIDQAGGSPDTSDITIRGNWIHGVSDGNGIIVFGNGVLIPNIDISNNMIWDVGIGTGAFVGTGHGAIGFFNVGVNTVIRHNTIVANTASGTSPTLMRSEAFFGVDDFSYNILVGSSSGASLTEWEVAPTQADFNIYFMTGGAGPFSATASYATLADWQADTGLDANSTDGDPLLASIVAGSENLHLTVVSTDAIDGALTSSETVDIDGDLRPFGTERDIGADESGIFNDVPTIAVSRGGTSVADGETLFVDEGDLLSALALRFDVDDDDTADTMTLTAVVIDAADITGFVLAEWQASGTGGAIVAMPATGSFDVPRLISVSLTASDDRGGVSTFDFTIDVNAAPVISVTSNGDAVADLEVLRATTGTTVTDLGLALTVTDADTGDTLDLTSTLLGPFPGAIASEWNASGTGGSVTATPTSGGFDTVGSGGSVQITATDGSVTTELFTVIIEVHEPPVISVTAVGADVAEDEILTVARGTVVAELQLTFNVANPLGDPTDLTAVVTDSSLISGFTQGEWDASGTGATVTAAPSLGVFDTIGSITVDLAATNDIDGSDSFSFTIAVSEPDNAIPELSEPGALTDIILGGADPSFTGRVDVGQDLGLSFEATDGDADDPITVSLAVTGGTLTAEEAGFAESFPHAPAAGPSTHTVTLSGAAQIAGTIEITITADDGNGGMDQITLTLAIVGGGGGDDEGGGGCCRVGDGADGAPGAAALAMFVLLVLGRRRRVS